MGAATSTSDAIGRSRFFAVPSRNNRTDAIADGIAVEACAAHAGRRYAGVKGDVLSLALIGRVLTPREAMVNRLLSAFPDKHAAWPG